MTDVPPTRPTTTARECGVSDCHRDDDRPEDCDCGEWNAAGDLACWPCFREGFDRPTSRPEVDQ